ncbi:MAG: hydroxyacylglutathione hydrolase [Alphaproteobacteria bacterium]
MSTLKIEIIPAGTDNYIYLLKDRATGLLGVVDPGAAKPVIDAMDKIGADKLDLILLTHHHEDHIAGVEELQEKYGGTIAGPAADAHRMPPLDKALVEGDKIRIGESKGHVIETPGHTSGHISVWFKKDGSLFCGDTLFSIGCGRMFEGSPAEMYDSLQKLADLPDRTRIFCGHESTASNAAFAATGDPGNTRLAARMEAVEALMEDYHPTLPALMGDEKAINPFLRCDAPEIRAAVGLDESAAPEFVFGRLRSMKDEF